MGCTRVPASVVMQASRGEVAGGEGARLTCELRRRGRSRRERMVSGSHCARASRQGETRAAVSVTYVAIGRRSTRVELRRCWGAGGVGAVTAGMGRLVLACTELVDARVALQFDQLPMSLLL